MKDESNSDKPDNSNFEVNFRHSIYVPEEKLFQRIPLCRYLSDLSSFFEVEDQKNEPEDCIEKKERL